MRKTAAALLLAVSAHCGVAQQLQKAGPTEGTATSTQSQDSRRAELLKQLAELEKRLRAEGVRRRYLDQLTEDEPFKSYYQRFVRRIEKAGTDQFPKKNGKAVHGSVLMIISIDSRGRLLGTEIVKSDDAFLSAHSIGLIRSLKPFEAFSPEMAKEVDSVDLGGRRIIKKAGWAPA